MINYRHASAEALSAWWKYRDRLHGSVQPISVQSFAAGFNARKADPTVQYSVALKTYQQSPGYVRQSFIRSSFRAGWEAGE